MWLVHGWLVLFALAPLYDTGIHSFFLCWFVRSSSHFNQSAECCSTLLLSNVGEEIRSRNKTLLPMYIVYILCVVVVVVVVVHTSIY